MLQFITSICKINAHYYNSQKSNEKQKTFKPPKEEKAKPANN